VNTIFNVARQAGLRTAWSDKHPACQMFSGPSGNGVQDYFTPEINSDALGYPAGEDWTSDNAATMQYDSYKVQAILNEIDGYNHSRTSHVGVPGIFGMNFQTISTAQKLPTPDGLTGGYLPSGKVPGPLLVRALNYLNTQVGRMVAEIRSQGLASSTALIISAKHGQSPTDPGDLKRVPDVPIIAAVNAAWTAAHPGAGALVIPPGRNVPILVDIPGLRHGEQLGMQAETTQIAPTILGLLGLNPQALRAVQIEHTRALPGFPGEWMH
jgi:hypothetical protein